MPGTGDECTFEQYQNRNTAAIHLHPEKARELIKEGAKRALRRYKEDKESFELLDISLRIKWLQSTGQQEEEKVIPKSKRSGQHYKNDEFKGRILPENN